MKLNRRDCMVITPRLPIIKVGSDYYSPDEATNVRPGELKAWYKIGRDYLFAVIDNKGDIGAHWHETKRSVLREYQNFGVLPAK